MRLLLGELLVDQIELSSNIFVLISDQSVFYIIMCSIVDNLFVYLLLPITVVSIIIVIISTVFRTIFVLAI
jgi:hypothetical protein